jgi:(R)-2-hydroxyacyl-CoA dehydratese activating ATPase
VFAESEVLSWLARGRRIEDILLGVHRSIAQRSFGLLRRVGIEEEITFTGGVTRNEAMVEVLNELLGTTLNVSEESHYMGALGAALFALERAAAGELSGEGGCRMMLHRRYGCRLDVYQGGVVDADGDLLGVGMVPTGFRLEAAAQAALDAALAQAGLDRSEIGYIATTGYGRNQIAFRDVQATDLTAQAWGTRQLFPGTRTVLDIGGQTLKAMRLDEAGKVRSFRLNDKCAAGTGAFLEKTARYLGYRIEEIGPLVAASTAGVPISGVCAVFAESEVINHVSEGREPQDIMLGAMQSLIEKCVRLMKRVQMESEFTLVGGIMRFPAMTAMLRENLPTGVNVPPEETVQFTGALGAAVLAGRRLRRIAEPAEVTVA